jgi:hypothetical protein
MLCWINSILNTDMSNDLATSPRFNLGQLVATLGVLEVVTHDEIMSALSRHLRGDWGDLDADDKQANDVALNEDSRLLSAYHTADGTKFWIITEADRSATTVLLPSEY